MPEPKIHELEIACQQVLLPDASVYSVQWVDVPGGLGPRTGPDLLLQHYFKVIRRCTLGLVRPTVKADGVHFRLLFTGLSLLSFAPARFEEEQGGEAVHLYINGGFLVQPGECDRGMFSLLSVPQGDAVRITVQLSDYCPLLLGSRTPSRFRRLFYGLTQSFVHKVVTVRYLSSLYRDLTGKKLRAGVTKVRVREGTEI